jgi:hypothetical protein
MHEAVPVVRPLQNHLPDLTHLTTLAALWMPQYLPRAHGAQAAAAARGGRRALRHPVAPG